MKALITGGAGFIGSHLCRLLLRQGFTIKVYDNFSSSTLSNLDSIESDVEIIESDIRNFDNLFNAIQSVDYVFHLAALVSVPQSIENPMLTYQVNAIGTLNVLLASLRAKVSRIVIASSCAVYGDNLAPLNENSLLMPKSPYAASKLTCESLAESFYHCYGLETICLRYFNVYGLGQKSASDYAAVIPRFLDCYYQGKSPTIYGDGLQTRDFIYVEDVATANLLAATASSEVVSKSRIFNIGTGTGINLMTLLDVINTEIGFVIQPEFHPPRVGDIKDSWADIRLAKTQLGFSCKSDIRAGIKCMLSSQPQK